VGGRNCVPAGLSIENDDVRRSYYRIVQAAPARKFGIVEREVYLSGKVVSDATGKPLIIADQLRPID